jgi:hypothetical protein
MWCRRPAAQVGTHQHTYEVVVSLLHEKMVFKKHKTPWKTMLCQELLKAVFR